MNQAHTNVGVALRAEPKLRDALSRLDGVNAGAHARSPEPVAQERADSLLARVAWSRIAEPGDGTAGALISAIGAEAALHFVIENASAAQITARTAHEGSELANRALEQGLARWRPRLDRAATVRDIENGVEARLRVVVPEDDTWPDALDDLGEHAPLVLWVRGNLAHLRSASMSVVGARAATGYGTHITAEIVDGVCAAGFTIISGAAYGIDAVAHRTALAAGTPTVAVLAGGADRAYPAAHDSLLQRVSEAGAVCAEMVPGAAPTRWRFLLRNRLIAALSKATLVTEAGVRSGTLNTAGHASELGRELGAVPGPVTSAASAGCHALIREYGASLITNAQDACELLGVSGDSSLADATYGAEPGEPPRQLSVHARILDALPLRGGRELPEVASRAGTSVADAMRALAELELLGEVSRLAPTIDREERWAMKRPR